MIARLAVVGAVIGVLFGCTPSPATPDVPVSQPGQSVRGTDFLVSSTPRLEHGFYVLEVEVQNPSDYAHVLLSLDVRLLGRDGERVGNAYCAPLSGARLYTQGHESFTMQCPTGLPQDEGFHSASFSGLQGVSR